MIANQSIAVKLSESGVARRLLAIRKLQGKLKGLSFPVSARAGRHEAVSGAPWHADQIADISVEALAIDLEQVASLQETEYRDVASPRCERQNEKAIVWSS